MDAFASAVDLAAAIRARKLSPVELVDACLARIDCLDPEVNAVTWRRDDAVRAEARAAEQTLMRGEAVAVVPFTPLVNITGQPAISLPVHWTAEGFPIGVQLIGKPWGEADLVRLASQLEAAAPWAHRRPTMATGGRAAG